MFFRLRLELACFFVILCMFDFLRVDAQAFFLIFCTLRFCPSACRLADKLEAMSERDRKIAGAVINAICENPRPEPREK